MTTLFLDLYGVLADSRAMEKAYNAGMAAILHGRYGGSPGTWGGPPPTTYGWAQAEGLRLDALPGTEREGEPWVEAVWRLNADQVAWVFTRAGIPMPDDAAQYAMQLEEDTVREIDAL